MAITLPGSQARTGPRVCLTRFCLFLLMLTNAVVETVYAILRTLDRIHYDHDNYSVYHVGEVAYNYVRYGVLARMHSISISAPLGGRFKRMLNKGITKAAQEHYF